MLRTIERLEVQGLALPIAQTNLRHWPVAAPNKQYSHEPSVEPNQPKVHENHTALASLASAKTQHTAITADLGYAPRSYSSISGTESTRYCASHAKRAHPCVAEQKGAHGPIVELVALELHRRLTGFQRLADRARTKFVKLLAILDDGERYLELGFASNAHYLTQEFHLGWAIDEVIYKLNRYSAVPVR